MDLPLEGSASGQRWLSARDFLLLLPTWLISSMPISFASRGMFDFMGDLVMKS